MDALKNQYAEDNEKLMHQLQENQVYLHRAKQRMREQWAVYYTSPQSFVISFSYSLVHKLWVLFNLIGWSIKLIVQTY